MSGPSVGPAGRPHVTRKLEAGRLILASHNQGKIREFDAFFAPRGIRVVGAGALGLAEPEVTGATF